MWRGLQAGALASLILSCGACAFEGGGYQTYGGYQSYSAYPGYQVAPGYPPYDSGPVFIPSEPVRVFGGDYHRNDNVRRDENRGRQSVRVYQSHQQRGGDNRQQFHGPAPDRRPGPQRGGQGGNHQPQHNQRGGGDMDHHH